MHYIKLFKKSFNNLNTDALGKYFEIRILKHTTLTFDDISQIISKNGKKITSYNLK